jgi:hypothetical protein
MLTRSMIRTEGPSGVLKLLSSRLPDSARTQDSMLRKSVKYLVRRNEVIECPFGESKRCNSLCFPMISRVPPEFRPVCILPSSSAQ